MVSETTALHSIDEAARRQFEADWKAGRPRPIEPYLPQENHAHYLPTLEELVLIEMEFIWKPADESTLNAVDTLHQPPAGEPRKKPPRVEEYLTRFPPLNQPGIVLRLLKQEYRVRERHGDRPSSQEYRERFPALVSTGQEVVPGGSGPGFRAPEIPGFEVGELIARGGMGVVYKARQISLGRVVALKMILTGSHAGPEELARFRTEAETVARLQHPNIVHIYEIGEHNHQPYLSLEFVDGGSLAQKIAGAPPSARQAAELVETLARAMHYAHQRGIVHRDLKPANILLVSSGALSGGESGNTSHPSPLTTQQLKITDFGLAKRLEGAAGQTQSGAILGTPSYMSPEQAAGRSRDIGPAADIYALGAILYELLTGRPPFQAATPMDTMLKVIAEEPVPPRRLQPRVHRDLETICLKALAKDPAQRYRSALALGEDLERFNAGEAIQARREGIAGKLMRKVRRRPLAAAAVVVGLVAAIVAGAIAWEVMAERRRAEVDRRVANLQSGLETSLDGGDWTPKNLTRLDELVADLERLAPDQARAARRRLNQRFAASIGASIRASRPSPEEIARIEAALKQLQGRAPEQTTPLRQALHQHIADFIGETLRLPRLESEDVARLESALKMLAERDPARAPILRQSVGQRLRDWQTVFELKAPFANAKEVLATPGWHVETGALAWPAPPKGAPYPLGNIMVLTRFPCEGSTQLEMEVDSSWGSAAEIGLLLNAAQTHAQPVSAMAFSADGQTLATASHDATVKLWNTSTGELRHTLNDPAGPVYCLAFLKDGHTLVTGTEKWVRFWDVAQGKQTDGIEAHQGAVLSLAVSPDGMRLATGGADKTAKVWDAAAHTLQKNLGEQKDRVVLVAFPASSNSLISITAGKDRAVAVWNLDTGARRTFTASLRFEEVQMALSPDGRNLAGMTWGPMKLWDVTKGKERAPFGGGYSVLAFSPDGKTLAQGQQHRNGTSEMIFLWDVESGRVRATLPTSYTDIQSLVFSSDGSTLASAGMDGTLKLWNVARGSLRQRLGGHNYTFVLAAPLPPSTGPTGRAAQIEGPGPPVPAAKLAGVQKAGGAVRLRIMRDGVLLREQEATLPPGLGTLRLRASREGSLLKFQVHDLPPLVFQDVFALTGRSTGKFGLSWPGSVRLTQVRASRQARAVAGSALERGDDFYGQGRFNLALAYFREQALGSGGSEVGREANFKAALCLVKLNRLDEASTLLERVANDTAGGRWPLVAASQLLLLRVGQNRFDDPETDALFESISSRYRLEDLAGLVTQEARKQIVQAYQLGSVDFLFFKTSHLRKFQRAVAVGDLFEVSWKEAIRIKVGLLHSYRILGMKKEALKVARDLFNRIKGLPPSWQIWGAGHALQECCWVLRRHGAAAGLLEEIDRLLLQGNGEPRPWLPFAYPLLLERARLHGALQQWAEAEKDLEILFRLAKVPEPLEYPHYAEACLLLGFLQERRGAKDEAMRTWRRGLFPSWRGRFSAEAQATLFMTDPKSILNHLILGSLTNELTEPEMRASYDRLTASASTDSPFVKMLRAFPLPFPAFKEAWRSARGREYARKFALRDLSFAEQIRVPAFLLAAEMFHQGAFTGALSQEQDDLLWKLTQDTFYAYSEGKLNQFQFLQLGLTWKGTAGSFGWAGVASTLEPGLRGPLAYLFGHRYLRKNKAKEAGMFFRTALADAPANSPLKRLAQVEIERLKIK